MGRKVKIGVVCFLLLWQGLSVTGVCQPGDPGLDPDQQDVPISGLEWLLIAGGMLGFRKVYQNYKSKRNH